MFTSNVIKFSLSQLSTAPKNLIKRSDNRHDFIGITLRNQARANVRKYKSVVPLKSLIFRSFFDLGSNVDVPAEVIVLNSIVLPHKELTRSVKNQIIL